MGHLRNELIRIQKKNYLKNLRLVKQSLGTDPGVSRYAREYHSYLQGFQKAVRKSELIRKIAAANIVYHGDYHTLTQSQRSMLRILREIVHQRRVILCVEMFHGEDQKWVDKFQSGAISEEKFLKEIQYHTKWPFHFDHWRPILTFCRNEKIPVVAINCEAQMGQVGLKKRDAYSARRIGLEWIRNPDALIYVIDGDYHVCPAHLPKQVNSRLEQFGLFPNDLIVYQNPENLYWKLAELGQEETDVLQIDDSSYCLMNTMPANKIQSYLSWLEYSEAALSPAGYEWSERDYDQSGLTLESMIQTVKTVLGVRLPKGTMNRISIHFAEDLDFMESLGEGISASKLAEFRRRINKQEAFLLEEGEEGNCDYRVYLPNSNINNAAEEAAHFVHAVLSGKEKLADTPFDRFYQKVLVECLGFFGSKLINEKRKAPTEGALRRFLGGIRKEKESSKESNQERIAALLLRHKTLERHGLNRAGFEKKFSAVYRSLHSNVSLEFATQLGYLLGSRLYYGVKKDIVTLARVRKLFRNRYPQKNRAFLEYVSLCSDLSGLRHPHQI